MKDIDKTIIDNFILLVGAGLFTYGLFRFIAILAKSSTSYYKENIDSTLIYLAIGVVAIVLWIVNKKEERN